MTQQFIGRSRNLLAAARLPEFIAWLEARGWQSINTVGADEVLRMRGADQRVLLVTRRDQAMQHVTVAGVALELALEFISQTKAKGGHQ